FGGIRTDRKRPGGRQGVVQIPDLAGRRSGHQGGWHGAGRRVRIWPVVQSRDLEDRSGVKTGSAVVEHKISAWPAKPDICALMSTCPIDPACAVTGAQELPPARATVPPSL